MDKCLIEDCDGKAKWKGLCGRCYYQARKLIEEGQVKDWDELETMGLCVIGRKHLLIAFIKLKNLQVPK
jgi:hypothetical protein